MPSFAFQLMFGDSTSLVSELDSAALWQDVQVMLLCDRWSNWLCSNHRRGAAGMPVGTVWSTAIAVALPPPGAPGAAPAAPSDGAAGVGEGVAADDADDPCGPCGPCASRG